MDSLIKGFGYSLSSGKDIDLNGYNGMHKKSLQTYYFIEIISFMTDLSIGAYDSGHAVVLRTRPLISVLGEVRSTIKKLPFDAETFEIESCIQYTGSTAPARMGIIT
jgi:hypothetical protein